MKNNADRGELDIKVTGGSYTNSFVFFFCWGSHFLECSFIRKTPTKSGFLTFFLQTILKKWSISHGPIPLIIVCSSPSTCVLILCIYELTCGCLYVYYNFHHCLKMKKLFNILVYYRFVQQTINNNLFIKIKSKH
jgi:hypothetical protein